MATKVEEERELLVKAIGCYDVFGDHKVSLGMNGMIDSLIAAAREDGRAEERERIRKAADHYQAEDECFAAQLVDGNYVGASYEMYVVSPSLLAPAPKEEGK